MSPIRLSTLHNKEIHKMSCREKYGWYSKKQHISLTDSVKYGVERHVNNSWEKKKHNSCIYQTENGDEVLCTEVTNTPNQPSSNYNDFVPVGKVVKFVKLCYTELQ